MSAEPEFLVADIGATRARFCRLAAGVLGEPVVLATGDYAAAGELIRAAQRRLSLSAVAGACFAVAGPVVDDRISVTNGELVFATGELEGSLGFPVRLVNDFHALARAVPDLARLEQLGGDAGSSTGRTVRAVLGPGSGLGMSVLVPEGRAGWRVLASEGGHADLAPGNHLEQELLNVLLAEHRSVCWETVLSGSGLVRLYRAVATLWGMPSDDLTPEQISERGVHADDPICHQALEMFFGLLGAAAGNLALTVCARGGVYIGGGIVPGLVEFARSSPLRRRFDERADLQSFIEPIPLYVILDEFPGLKGAAACLDDPDPRSL